MKIAFRAVYFIAVLVLLCAVNGCSDLNGTRLEPVLGGEINLVKLGDKVAESLISQVMPPLHPYQSDQPILVTTLANNDNLNDSSSFGRSFQNNIAAGFVSRGYAVKEIKLRKEMLVEVNDGEFMLTRNLQAMAGKQRAQAVVVGTYVMVNRMMYLSIRLVNPVDQGIRATYEDRLYLDENTLRMLGLQFDKGAAANEASDQVRPPSPSILDTLLY